MENSIFKALGDPVRRGILDLLRKNGKLSAGEIASHFDLTNATISYHLSLLKKADLIFETKEKNYIYYQINLSVFQEFIMWINQFGGKKDEE